jgi:hypothetical protein
MTPVTFGDAFNYPFRRFSGLFNILWVFVPILGWLLLYGYTLKITKEFLAGKYDELPNLDFNADLALGWRLFVRIIPFSFVYGVVAGALMAIAEEARLLLLPFELLVLPMLFINFIKKETVASSFEFSVVRPVLANFGEYVMAMLKSIGLGLVFMVLSLVLVGIPAGAFTRNIFLADFYRRHFGDGPMPPTRPIAPPTPMPPGGSAA